MVKRDTRNGKRRQEPKTMQQMTERQTEAIRLRHRRLTYQEIADRLYNGNRGNAHTDIQRGLKVVQKDEASDVRQMEMDLLDEIIRPQIAGAFKGDIKAFHAVIRGMERRAAYLGLDAPKDVTLGGTGNLIVEFGPELNVVRQTEPDLEVDADDE